MSTTLAQWQSAWPALAATALALPALSQLLALTTQRRQQQQCVQAVATLDYLLTMFQQLQRHRALGGRSDHDGRHQRARLASELDLLWRDWPHHFPDECDLPAAWPALRANAADFDGHCRLIERLLAAIALVEQRTGSSDCCIAARCRVVEELGQLRGLSVRASAPSATGETAHCPVQLEVPIRYLCQRLAGGGPAQSNALRAIEQRLLARCGDPLTPADCFALLTPLIDRTLESVRRDLHGAHRSIMGRTAPKKCGNPVAENRDGVATT
jgi:hypothetical protein